jgi:hypothetical protein
MTVLIYRIKQWIVKGQSKYAVYLEKKIFI